MKKIEPFCDAGHAEIVGSAILLEDLHGPRKLLKNAAVGLPLEKQTGNAAHVRLLRAEYPC